MTFLFGWIPVLGAVIIKALKQVIGIIVLVMFIAALISWAKTHPDQSKAMFASMANDLSILIPKVMNALMSVLISGLDWLAGLGK